MRDDFYACCSAMSFIIVETFKAFIAPRAPRDLYTFACFINTVHTFTTSENRMLDKLVCLFIFLFVIALHFLPCYNSEILIANFGSRSELALF